MKWTDSFVNECQSRGLDCRIFHRWRGWLETVFNNGQRCFTKSVTFNNSRELYFIGVDTKKVDEKGDYVIICGGSDGKLRDIFLIPWNEFFKTLAKGAPLNTYRYKEPYYQYKFKVQEKDGRWIMLVQGGEQPELDVNQWRYSVDGAVDYLQRK